MDDQTKLQFLEYGGSHYEMERAGVYADYQALKVTRRQEPEWGRERGAELLAGFRCIRALPDQSRRSP